MEGKIWNLVKDTCVSWASGPTKKTPSKSWGKANTPPHV